MAYMNSSQLVKCHLVNLDESNKQIPAMFNPKEISIDKSVPWNAHKSSKGDHHVLEFTDGQPKTLSVELFFDTYELKENVYDKWVKPLIELTEVKKDAGSDDQKRPPLCMFVWGDNKFPKFTGVIESLQTKYTMFLPDGTPVRATCSIKMKEAASVVKGTKSRR